MKVRDREGDESDERREPKNPFQNSSTYYIEIDSSSRSSPKKGRTRKRNEL